MLPALLLTALTLAAPATAGVVDPLALGEPSVTLIVAASPERVSARADSPLGWQLVDVWMECVPDLEADCDTVIDCEPDSANCYATRRPRPPFPCRVRPDGSMVCNINQTDPNQTEPPTPEPMVPTPPCSDLASPGLCSALPQPSDDIPAACRHLFHPSLCQWTMMPTAPPLDPLAACGTWFTDHVCSPGGLPAAPPGP